MELIEPKWNPSPRELRQFAGIWLVAFLGLVGALIGYRTGSLTIAVALWSAAVVIAVVGLSRPSLIRPLYVAWIGAAYPIGWTVSHLILAVVFYGIMTPVGIAMRLFGYDPMQRRIDRSAKTYWVRHDPGEDTARYFRQL